jgi:hypothetical protein
MSLPTYLVPFLFVAMWVAVVTFLRNLTGMTTRLELPLGEPLRRSQWGSASINGVRARNCVRVEEYSDGFVVRMMWLFGDGKLWLPKLGLHVSKEQRTLFLFRSQVLESGVNRVVLFGRLAEFVGDPATDDDRIISARPRR